MQGVLLYQSKTLSQPALTGHFCLLAEYCEYCIICMSYIHVNRVMYIVWGCTQSTIMVKSTTSTAHTCCYGVPFCLTKCMYVPVRTYPVGCVCHIRIMEYRTLLPILGIKAKKELPPPQRLQLSR